MGSPTSLGRALYGWTVAVASPGLLWAAYEMYGLTIRGPQMLFFSISHGNAPVLLLVILGMLAAPLWVAQSLLALCRSGYTVRSMIPMSAHSIVVIAVGGHIALGTTYDAWSISSYRTLLCSIGFVLTAAMIYVVSRYLVLSLIKRVLTNHVA